MKLNLEEILELSNLLLSKRRTLLHRNQKETPKSIRLLKLQQKISQEEPTNVNNRTTRTIKKRL